jgi:hypothetical protein
LQQLCPPSSANYDQLLGEEITLLAGQLNAGSYRLINLIARFDDRKAWLGGGTIHSCAHWLNWQWMCCSSGMGSSIVPHPA